MKYSRVLKIARMGNPILRQRAQEVPSYQGENPWPPETYQIISDMQTTMKELWPITGLAAPQVFIPRRIVLYAIPKSRSRGTLTQDIPLTVMINPQIDILSQEKTLDWEGCLSLPGLLGEVSRYRYIRVHYKTPQGISVTQEVSDFHARVIQHECDHLDGILYPQRMEDISRLAFEEEVSKNNSLTKAEQITIL